MVETLTMGRLPRLFAIMLASAAVVPAALACGDKLSAMGGGIRFERLHRAAHPARLVVYMPPQSGLRRADSELQLVKLLTRAGHDVKVVEAPDELQRILAAAGTDLVLAGATDLRDAGRALDEAGREDAAPGKTGAAAVVRIDYGRDGPAPANGASDPCLASVSRRTGGSLVRTIDAVLRPGADGQPRLCR